MARAAQSDARLVEQASSGDLRALAGIFKRYHDDLFRYCAALLGNSEDAADALQNTMVKVLRALPGERREVSLKPWLYRIAHNESIELLRKRRDHDSIDPEALVGPHTPEASAETRERLRQLIVDLRELPERQRGSLVMRELGGLSFEQIGAAFETSAAMARQTIYEARLGLREMEDGRAMECAEVRRKLSDGDRRVFRRRDVRAHLRACGDCREFETAISGRRADLAAISPLPALAAAGMLKGVIGAAGASTGSVAGAGAAGGAVSASVATKAAITMAVAGAIGIGAADRAGVVHLFHRDGGDGAPAAPLRRDSGPGGSPAATPEKRQAAAGGGREQAGAPGPPTSGGPRDDGRQAASADAQGGQSAGGGPDASPSPSTAGTGRGHEKKAKEKAPKEKASGKGTGSANAHGGNSSAHGGGSNAHGGNPNAKGGGRAAATSHAQHGVGGGSGEAQGAPKPAREPVAPRKEAQPPSSPGPASKPPLPEVEPGLQPESGSPPAPANRTADPGTT